MIKVVVVQLFADKDNFAKKYSIGEVVEFEKERAKYLIEKGLVRIDGEQEDGLNAEQIVETREKTLKDKEADLEKRETELRAKEQPKKS